MLLQFTVENFLSFKEKAILSLIPSKDREHLENINVKKENKALNTIVTYGANASGKTSLFKALTVAIIMIRTSNNRQVNEMLPVTPFKFDCGNMDKPCKFEFQFVAEDGKKYIYGFSATRQIIVEEYLYKYSSRKPTQIFERKAGDHYEFTARESKLLSPLVAWNTPNKLFLATATMWNSQATKIPFEWFAKCIDTYTDLMQLSHAAVNAYQGEEAASYVAFTEKLLKSVDINISKLSVKTKKIPTPSNMIQLIPGIIINDQMIRVQEQIQLEVTASHLVADESGNEKEFSLLLSEESQGTQLLFTIGPVLKNAFEKGLTIVIDEIDRSLHTFIVRHLVNAFRDPSINTGGAQLIVTTHDTSLLSLDLLRRDQIYFVEKNNKTAISDLYSLDDCSVRKNENIEKGYLAGRYGAIPFLRTGDIL